MKVRVLKVLVIGVVVFSLVLLSGCGTLETLLNKDGTATSIGDLIGEGGDKIATLPATSNSSITPIEGKVIALYFADSTGKYLVREERTLPKTVSLAKETVNQWIKGPAVKGATVQATVPAGTMLLDINIKDYIATVDLSKEFLQSNAKVSPEVVLYSLVNTLTQFSTIKEVDIRVEGKAITKYGTLDATHLVNKASLVKGAASGNPIIPEGTGTDTGTGNTGSGLNVPDKTSKGTLPSASPSTINLFDYPSSST
ncbi:MAG TPA: GerMN domain-containing protein [Desulfosporosinus sp.]|nr:GerMN domain-containing protein [Desulfosporosinus sp.]